MNEINKITDLKYEDHKRKKIFKFSTYSIHSLRKYPITRNKNMIIFHCVLFKDTENKQATTTNEIRNQIL